MDCPCTKSELEVFRPVNVQVALTEGRWHTYMPLHSTDNADSMEFVIPGTSTEMVDMNNMSLFIAAKIKLADNDGDLGDGAAHHVQLVNNAFGALFRNIDVMINGQLITHATREYAYKDYLQRLLIYDMPKGGVQQASIGFYPDTAGQSANLWNNANTGATERREMIHLSRRFELRGNLCIDFFDCSRLLMPGTDINIKLFFNEPKFFLHAANNATEYKLAIEDAELYVRRVTVSDSVLNGLHTSLQSQEAIYPFVRREITSFNIPQGFSSYNQENLFRGQLGQRYFIALVHSTAANGSYSTNPFELKHFNLTEIALYENGQSIAGPPIKLNMAQRMSLNAYYQLLESIGAIGERALYPPLTYEDFKSHSTVFCFTRSPDLSHGEGDVTLPSQVGNLSLRLNFSAATTHPITCLVLGEFDSRVKLNRYKNATTDYAV